MRIAQACNLHIYLISRPAIVAMYKYENFTFLSTVGTSA